MTLSPLASSESLPRPGLFGLQGPMPLLVACLLGAFASSSYNSMVNVALPSVGRGFGVDLSEVQWIVLVYLLANSSSIFIAGRLSDMFGSGRTYRVGLAIFTLGGLACALAPGLSIQLVTRPLQAIGTGLYIAAIPAMLTEAFPDRQRGKVIGLYSTAVYVGLTAGPMLGGVLTDLFDWRAVFWATVVVGGCAFFLAWRHVPLDRGKDPSTHFDVAGSVVYVFILLPILLALSRARQWGPTSPAVLGLLATGVLAAVVFVRIERRSPAPVIDLRLFASRYFSSTALAQVMMFIGMYSVNFLMPFYLVQARGFSASVAGLLVSAESISMVLVAPLVGALSDRLGPRAPATFGALLLGCALFLLAQLGATTPLWYVIVILALVGAGAGFSDVANATAIMGSVPPERRGMASATSATVRYVGQSMGVAVSGSIFALTVGPDVGPESWAGFTAAFMAVALAALVSAALSFWRGQATGGASG